MRRLILILAGCLAYVSAAQAGSGSKTVQDIGTGVAIALPLTAGGIALGKEDWTGMAQLGVETVLTVGTALALKQIVREKRPDGSDFQSFPSDTTALAASGSAFLWGRYGWRYGLPAFVASQFVSYSRVQADKHHWYDTLASSAIAVSYGYFVTSRYRGRNNFYTSLDASPAGARLNLAYSW